MAVFQGSHVGGVEADLACMGSELKVVVREVAGGVLVGVQEGYDGQRELVVPHVWDAIRCKEGAT
eukprot:817560-Ditylum_brightwellii.AAC.1